MYYKMKEYYNNTQSINGLSVNYDTYNKFISRPDIEYVSYTCYFENGTDFVREYIYKDKE